MPGITDTNQNNISNYREQYLNTLKKNANRDDVKLEENYIYISHLDDDYKYWYLPSSPDTINDALTSSFGQTNVLGRSAPVYTYQYSGGRQVQVDLQLQRDLMDDVNIGNEGTSNVTLLPGEDYVDNLIKAIQSIALPRYNESNKAVEPPLVAVRFGTQVFIKGIVNGAVGVTYAKPILWDGRWANVRISFTVTEVDPYTAQEVFKNGSFRGVVKTMKAGMGL